MKQKKYQCPCCRYYTYEHEPDGSYDICPVCFWEDDIVQQEDESYEGGANRVSLIQARENFKSYGACEPHLTEYVRRPLPDEMDV